MNHSRGKVATEMRRRLDMMTTVGGPESLLPYQRPGDSNCSVNKHQLELLDERCVGVLCFRGVSDFNI